MPFPASFAEDLLAIRATKVSTAEYLGSRLSLRSRMHLLSPLILAGSHRRFFESPEITHRLPTLGRDPVGNRWAFVQLS